MNIFKFPALWLLVAAGAFAQQAPQATPPAAAPATSPAVAPATPPVPQATAPAAPPPAPIQFTIPATPDSAAPLAVVPSSSSVVSVFLPVVSSSSSAVETPAAPPEEKTIFDSVRGHAYNPYGTVGAPSTVRDLVTTPSDINGQKFIYVSPTDKLGYTAFPLGDGSTLLGLDNSPLGSPAALILGYANSSFGLALNYSVSKIWESNDSTKVDTRTTRPGDNIGLYLSIPVGSATVYANASWLTYATRTTTDNNGKETDVDFSAIEGNAGLTGSSGSLNYDVYLNIIRTGGTLILPNDDKLVDEEYSYLGGALNFNVSSTVLQSSTARVMVGSNNFFSMRFFDSIKTPKKDGDNIIGFVIAPNILGEVSLFDNWLAFTGATHAINLVAGDGDRYGKTSRLEIGHTPSGTAAFAGVRYQKPSWAVEAEISANMFDNPFGGFNGKTMFAGFGGFVYF